MGNFLTKIKLKIVLMTAAVGIALSSCYSFTGSSLSPETKTILIKNFPNNAALVNSDLSQDFTMALQNMFLQRTSLKGTSENNKLTITIHVNYENKIEPEKNFNKTFSGEATFSSDLDINAIESSQVRIVNERIINQIFNEIVANW